MPFTPTNPSSDSVVIEDTKTLDKFQILGINISLSASDQTATLQVTWCKGWVDESNVFHVGKTFVNTIEGENLQATMAAEVDGTLYDVIKDQLWALMQTEGIVPAGTVS